MIGNNLELKEERKTIKSQTEDSRLSVDTKSENMMIKKIKRQD